MAISKVKKIDICGFGKKFSWSLLTLCLLFGTARGQEVVEKEDDHRAIRPPFESTWLIDQQTSVVPPPKPSNLIYNTASVLLKMALRIYLAYMHLQIYAWDLPIQS